MLDNSFKKATFAYVIANAVSYGVNLIVTPLFTHWMSAEQIGIWTNYSSLFSLLSTITSVGLSTGSFSIAMMEFDRDRDGYRKSVMLLQAIVALLFSVICLVFWRLFLRLTGLTTITGIILLLELLFFPAITFWLAQKRYEYKYQSVMLVTMIPPVFGSLVAVITVWLAKNGNSPYSLGELRIAAYAGTAIIIGLFFFFSTVVHRKFQFNARYWRFGLKLSLPLLIQMLSKQILDVSDRQMIRGMIGFAEAGIYGSIYSISSVALIVWTALNTALIPKMFNAIKAGSVEYARRIGNLSIQLFAVFSLILILTLRDLIMLILPSTYHVGLGFVTPIVLGVYNVSIYTVFSNILLSQKRTKEIMIATLTSATVNVVLNYILLPIFGMIAAAYTTLVAYVVLGGIMYYFLSKHKLTAYVDFRNILMVSTVTMALGGIFGLITPIVIRYTAVIILVVMFIRLLTSDKTQSNRNK